MTTFDFTVILADRDEVSEDDAEKLFEAGCDDATPGSTDGVALIHFSRNAHSLQEAILSAKSDVEQAGFSVARVEMGVHEIAVLEAS